MKKRVFTIGTLWALLALGGCGDEASEANADGCPVGTEGCACFENASCHSELSCLSDVCVRADGTGGDLPGSGGTDAGTGGESTGSGATGGTSTGGTDTGGTNTGGSASGGTSTGGTDPGGTGGANSCGDTQSDPLNCGSCGHVCKNADPVFEGLCPTVGGVDTCCSNGACTPTFSACFTEAEAVAASITSCDDYCASVGETCAPRGCVSDLTWQYWLGTGQCAAMASTRYYSDSTSGCRAALPFEGVLPDERTFRCCCTDTQ